MPNNDLPGGILVINTADKIQADYFPSYTEHATFLPPERILTEQYQVSRSTMRRALALLTQRGLLRAEHGRGYRILKNNSSPSKVRRIAILQAAKKSLLLSGRAAQEITDAMQSQSLKRKWQVLNIDIGEINPIALIEDLKNANIQAVAMVFEDKKIVEALLKARIPCISLENFGQELDVDYIFQDNYGGARKAAGHLISCQHRRIAWVGPIKESFVSFTRWSGARSILIEKGLDFSEQDIVTESVKLEEAIRTLLIKKNRPKAIIALWERQMVSVIRVAEELKLKLGKDFDLIGWSNDTRYQVLKNDIIGKNGLPPMVVWSPDEMAEVAISRLLLRWQEPDLNSLYIAVPAKLVLPKN